MKKHLVIALILCSLIGFSQNEASYWYFGQNAGLRFDTTTGNVTALTDGQIDQLEGCTSISDSDGTLQFYTDGRDVWNRNHQVMQNGDYFGGTGLLGDPSSTSSGLIVPKPGNSNQYYVFTVDEPHHENAAVYPNQFSGTYQSGGGSVPGVDDGFNNGFNYSLVDMTLNGGLGNVDTVEKNIPLITYDVNDSEAIKYKCSEKITAVRAEDCEAFWVITHFVDTFYAFKIDTNGVSTTPVTSTVGPLVPIQGYRRNALGYLKASPDASKLLIAHFGFAQTVGGNAGGGIYLYDFDNNTGIVSNNIELYSPQNNDSPYGVEFSAETRKAYATIGAGAGGGGQSQVLQWDLESTDIPNSMQVVHASNVYSAGALQLGVDRRIYRAQVDFSNFSTSGRFLGIIDNPEADGINAGYNENGILVDVGGNSQNLSRIGLPPFIQSLFSSQVDIIRNGESTTELKLCIDDNYILQADDIPGADYAWLFNGAPLAETSFQLFVDTPGFYEVYVEPNNGDCPIEGSALVGVFDIPIANPTNNEIVCDNTGNNDGIASFTFTNKDSDILQTQDANQYNVYYFESLDDATNNENEITFPYLNTQPYQQTIFVRIENNDSPNCFDTTSFTITIFDTPQIIQFQDTEFCDNSNDITDGIATVDLSSLIPAIIGSQNNTEVTFHASQENADDDVSPLPLNYTNTNPVNETLFVRIENTLQTNCYSTSSFEIIINPSPEAIDTTVFQCDEDGIPEGLTVFNINQQLDAITNNANNVEVSYYLSQGDATNMINPIDGDAYANISNPQTVVARVMNTVTSCVNYANVTLAVSTTHINDAAIQACDDDGIEDGFFSFDLSNADPIVLAGAPVGLPAVYYETYNDALLELNPITSSSYTNTTPYNQTIFARVENDNACFGISEVTLTVFDLPNIETAFEALYCLNDFPQTLVLDGGVIDDDPSNYFYEWSTGETTSEIEVNMAGTYTVRVSNTNGCFKDRTLSVLPSNIATINDVIVIDATDSNSITIEASGEGEYEYALNANGPFQLNPAFYNLQPGFYTVFVRDIKNNCGVVSQLVSVIGFPKFFTPDYDSGINPFWNVKGISEQFQPNSKILIFNRNGKLMTELNPLGPGWDGLYNGRRMPTDDYWFKVTLQDGRVFTSHFTLKR